MGNDEFYHTLVTEVQVLWSSCEGCYFQDVSSFISNFCTPK